MPEPELHASSTTREAAKVFGWVFLVALLAVLAVSTDLLEPISALIRTVWEGVRAALAAPVRLLT